MKKIAFITALFCVCTLTPSYGQGILNRINKGLNKVNKELDKLSGKEEKDKSDGRKTKETMNRLPETANTGQNGMYGNVLVRSFRPDVHLSLESCVREGNKVTITYFLTNNGNDFTISELGIKKSVINKVEETMIMDDKGSANELRHFSIGGANELSIKKPVPAGVPLKSVLEIYNVPLAAKQLTLVNIAGLFDKTANTDIFVPFSFAFRNVPIYTKQEVLQAMNATSLLTVKKPYVEKLADENFVVEAVEFTDKYTKVDLLYNNKKYNPVAYLTPDDMNNINLSAGGKTYDLIDYMGVTPRKHDVAIKYNQAGRYSYIFEPLPTDTEIFDLAGEGIIGVTIKDNTINIPKTKGMFQSLDTNYDAYYKQPRMTANDRAKYKINTIRHTDFPEQLPNNQLAKGKSIYKCNKGSLETFLVVVTDQVTSEYLVSYDKAGKVIDCICIGVISAYGGDRGYAEISGNKVTVYSSYPTEDENDSGESVTDYRINPDLRFVKL